MGKIVVDLASYILPATPPPNRSDLGLLGLTVPKYKWQNQGPSRSNFFHFHAVFDENLSK